MCRATAGAGLGLPLFTSAPKSRIVTVREAGATEAFQPAPEKVAEMVRRGITNFARLPTVKAAWLSLISTQDTVGIKVFSAPGASVGTRPAVVAAVVEGLLEAGIATNRIVIWDKLVGDLDVAGFTTLARHYGVRVSGSQAAGYDEQTFYDKPLVGALTVGDVEFNRKSEGVGRKSFVSKLLVKELTKIINVAPLLNHNRAGVSGCLYSLAMGSVDNTVRFEQDAGRLAEAVPEIYALQAVGDKVVLHIVDALIAQYEGEQHTLLHYSAAVNELRFSADPVALDVLSLRELELQRQGGKLPPVASRSVTELFENAALLELGVNDPHKIQLETIP